MSDYLYRVTIEATDVWSKYSRRKLKPVYVVMPTKEKAADYAGKHLNAGLKVKSVSLLGNQLGACFFSGNNI